MKIYILNGPNLNLLGQREPEHYGNIVLGDILTMCKDIAQQHNVTIRFEQCNYEGGLVELVHEAIAEADGILINAGAYSHTSIALLDALKVFQGMVVEIHLSNIYKREEFRHHSYLSARADAVICGCGAQGYGYGLLHLIDTLKSAKEITYCSE